MKAKANPNARIDIDLALGLRNGCSDHCGTFAPVRARNLNVRDAIIISFIVVFSLAALRSPWVGVMLWTWLSIMNPHKYGWLSASLPLAALIAGCTLLGALITKDRRTNPFATSPAALLLMFALWICIAYPFSINREASFEMWSRVMKIDLMIFVTLMLLHSRRHIMAFLWVLVGSLGFYGVKGGLFTLVTGGNYRVWGPPGSFIEGNNELALALIMTIPLMRFLQTQVVKAWQKHCLTAAMLLTAFAALGSHSRGALVAIAAMALVLWTRSANKLVVGGSIALVAIAALLFMPEAWESRMANIGAYQEDASAMGRINAWWMTWNLATDRFFGGGFNIYERSTFVTYAPDPEDVHAAHSIYFQVLGEQGFVGLLLFLLMWWLVWRTAASLRKEGLLRPETRWVSNLAAMCQVSIVGYAVGGAFLSLAYFDLPYDILVLVVLAQRCLRDESREKVESTKGQIDAGRGAHAPPLTTRQAG
jgi:putative inorganic carbon (HCO3(-)) transporter